MTELFFKGEQMLPEGELRGLARNEVLGSPLIQACRSGSIHAAQSLHVGFWEFVKQFEEVIDERGKELLSFRAALQKIFPQTRQVILSIAQAVKEMKAEEGSHAQIWVLDAEAADFGNLKRSRIAGGVERLIESARSSPLWMHYCVLAGTEYIAEELSRVLARESPAFVAHFPSLTWQWGDIHLADHHEGPSHRVIDEDLAKALFVAAHPEAHDQEIYHNLYTAVADTIHLFGEASADVHTLFGVESTARLAAE